MGEPSKLKQVMDASESEDLEMGKLLSPVEVKEIELVGTSKPAEAIDFKERGETSTPAGAKLSGINIDSLDLNKKDFYQELEAPLSIFIVPTYIRLRDKDAYEPKMVSIGPYHYGKKELQPMQSHKERALIHFLKRSRKNRTIQPYINALTGVVGELRKCYEEIDQIKEWEDAAFVRLMLLDGVFLYEFLSVLRGNEAGHDYADIDPIFGNRGHNLNYNYVMEDLLLLENQIPYQVLFTLLTISEGHQKEAVDRILSSLMMAPQTHQGPHFLDMYIKGMLGERNGGTPNTGESNVKVAASKLSRLGIKFRKVGTYKDIEFDKNKKTLSLPSIVINQHTVFRFFNSKAYELRTGTNKDLNSYIHLLNFLIQSTDDVSSLRSQGIIVSSLAKDEEVVEVMKKLTKDTVQGDVDDDSRKIVTDVTKYYEDNEGKASVLRIWVANNWAKLLFAGIFLYALTAFQAVYTALSFHYRNK
ncbi:hypothetical protein MKX01_031181 [Papaver californicum]|nr:hypothetical protein MKX01_031181 [Papaver californicum]